MATLAPPQTDLGWLRRRVATFAEDRPGVYRMVGPADRVLYVGKAKRVRSRLLSYFRARYPDDKAARILHAAARIEWDYLPSEFAACLGELRQIRRHRPVFNVRMNRTRRPAFIKLTAGPAPKLLVGSRLGTAGVRHYGPLGGATQARAAVRVLSDLLGLRDCALAMPATFQDQGDLFGSPPRAACLRYEFGTCAGPCAGFVTERGYGQRVQAAVDFLEGRSIAPIDRVVDAMVAASEDKAFELAARWRYRLDTLEWLLRALVRARTAVDSLSFIYLDPGTHGDDRAYLIRRATVRAVAPVPRTPIEREAFRAVVAQHTGPEPTDVPLPPSAIDEMLLLMRWFRSHPGALRRTTAVTDWLDAAGDDPPPPPAI